MQWQWPKLPSLALQYFTSQNSYAWVIIPCHAYQYLWRVKNIWLIIHLINEGGGDWIVLFEVVHRANGPTATSEYEHSSIPATVRKLFNLPQPPLTAREAWAGNFASLITRQTPRTDTPGAHPKSLWLNHLQLVMLGLNSWSLSSQRVSLRTCLKSRGH